MVIVNMSCLAESSGFMGRTFYDFFLERRVEILKLFLTEKDRTNQAECTGSMERGIPRNKMERTALSLT